MAITHPQIVRAALATLAAILTSSACSAGEADVAHETTDAAAAYQTLVADIAACGKQAAQCARASAPDADAVAACGQHVAQCAMVGSAAVQAIAGAAAACGADMRECVTGGGEGEACSRELRACLGVASDDSDVDVMESGDGGPIGTPGGAARDCAAQLEGCIAAGNAPMSCAQSIRSCVLDALPEPADLAADPDEELDVDGGAQPGAGIPDMLPVPADLPEQARAAITCLEQLHACTSGGEPAPTCLEQLRTCMQSSHP